MSLNARDTIIRQQRELLEGLALCKVSDTAWRKKNFTTVCEGLLSNRIYEGNIQQIHRVIEEFFPTFFSLSLIHKKKLNPLLLGLKTTGLPIERIHYYHQKLAQFVREQNRDPQLLDFLDLDAGYAIAEALPETEPHALLDKLMNYQLMETEQKSLDVQHQFVVVKQRFNLFDTWSNPPQVLTSGAEPPQKPYVLFYNHEGSQNVRCIPFSNLKGLRFLLSMSS